MIPFVSSNPYFIMKLNEFYNTKEVLEREVTPYKLIDIDLLKKDI